MRIFYKMFWHQLYYNTIRGISNLFNYFKIVWKMAPWDFNSGNLEMFKFQLEQLLVHIENGYEVDEDRIPKENDIKRCIELLNNLITDNYAERCGGYNRHNYPIEFEKLNDGSGNSRLKDFRTEQERNQDYETLTKSFELENKEWLELWEIVAKGKHSNRGGAQGWWD